MRAVYNCVRAMRAVWVVSLSRPSNFWDSTGRLVSVSLAPLLFEKYLLAPWVWSIALVRRLTKRRLRCERRFGGRNILMVGPYILCSWFCFC